MKYAAIAFLLLSPLLRAAEPEKPKDDPLRQELLKRVKEDQEARKAMIEWMQKEKPAEGITVSPFAKKLTEIDQANTEWLKGIIEKQGWPGNSLVGKDGAQAAWLLVQHADRDRAFQKKCLGLMKELLAKGEVDRKNFAYLTDRVLIGEGKEQLYGTQFIQVNGKWIPQPIKDASKVDERRKEMGMSTLDEYSKQIEQIYSKPTKK